MFASIIALFYCSIASSCVHFVVCQSTQKSWPSSCSLKNSDDIAHSDMFLELLSLKQKLAGMRHLEAHVSGLLTKQQSLEAQVGELQASKVSLEQQLTGTHAKLLNLERQIGEDREKGTRLNSRFISGKFYSK